jgi:hypothetical protein
MTFGQGQSQPLAPEQASRSGELTEFQRRHLEFWTQFPGVGDPPHVRPRSVPSWTRCALAKRTSPAPVDKTQANIGAGATIVGGAMVAVGSFLPWVTASTGFGSVSRGGMDGGDGVISVIAGGVIVLVCIAGLLGNRAWIVGLVAAIVAGFVGIVNLQDVQERIIGLGEYTIGEVGIGLWLILGGAVVAGVGSSISATAPRAEFAR